MYYIDNSKKIPYKKLFLITFVEIFLVQKINTNNKMKNSKVLIILILISNLINSQTLSEFSSGYTSLEGIAINSDNEVYVSEHDSGKIYKLDSNGNKTLVATAGGYANDMVFDLNNNLYINEPFTTRISIVDNATGLMSEYKSTFSIGNSPYGIAIYEGLIYFSSENSGKVIKINSDLTTTDYVTGLFTPEGIAFDSKGNLYVADINNRMLFKITPDGTKTTVASNIINIKGVAVSIRDEVFFTTYNSYPLENKIIKYDPTTGVISDFATTMLDQPRSIDIDHLGNMYVTNNGNGTVIKITDSSLLQDPTLVYIPDANFKSELINNALININMDGEIQKSEANVFEGTISITDKNISDLTGFEVFFKISTLNCSDNQLTSLDVSNNTYLTSLSCSNNKLTSLVVSNNTALEYLSLAQNSLTDLNLLSNINLKSLDYFNNDISTIDLSKNLELTNLNCQTNGITTLDITANTKLTDINIGSNINITEIDLTANVLLEKLSFQQISITSLDLSNNTNLKEILGSSTPITSIDLRNGNNTNITSFSILNAHNLSCIFVDDKDYSQSNWTNPMPGTTEFVEKESECATLSTEDFVVPLNFKIYPNPTSKWLNIDFPIKKATIYNIQGEKLLFSTKQYINVENLSRGIYLIQIEDDNHNLITNRFIKK